MSATRPYTQICSFKSIEVFREYAAALGLDLPADDAILTGTASPLAQPVTNVLINGRRIGNRWATQPMEGWDGTSTGAPTDDTRRRWHRFGESGAKLVFGGEAMAVRMDARANPRQLVINDANKKHLAELVGIVRKAHRQLYGTDEDLVVGFQLTHSGRFCRPNDNRRPEPQAAFRHPLLDRRTGVTDDSQVLRDPDIQGIIEDFVRAAQIASDVGADFVDLKHCHGYLLHEILAAHTRPGRYGGSFENRTRPLRDMVAGIRAAGVKIDLAVRLSAFDTVPYHPDPPRDASGRPGPGVPDDFQSCLPYKYGFAVNHANPVEPDLTESFAFLKLCGELGVKMVNVTGGSPYYNPHIQRPALFPPSDGYQPPEDPLAGVARHIHVTRQLKDQAPPGMVLIGSAYTYLQDYLPHVAQAVLCKGWTDIVGLGRAILAYPTMLSDAVMKGAMNSKQICRTFSMCTTAPRKGEISGCYPLDPYYKSKRKS
ncbi:MAG: NADH:flavin oxidoreductase [Verrucomicrobiia bacterium]